MLRSVRPSVPGITAVALFAVVFQGRALGYAGPSAADRPAYPQAVARSAQTQPSSRATGLILDLIAGKELIGPAGDGGPAIDAFLDSPFGVAVDSTGNIFVSERGGHRVRRIDTGTGVITTIAGNGTGGFTGDGGPGAEATLNTPMGLAIDRDGILYIADSANNRVRRVDPADGVITTMAGNGKSGVSGDGGPATEAELRPLSLACDSNGDLYISDVRNGRIRKVDIATGAISTFAEPVDADDAALKGVFGIAFDAADNLFLAGTLTGSVRVISASDGELTTLGGSRWQQFSYGDGGHVSDARFYLPWDIACAPNGDIYVSEADGRIRKIDRSTWIVDTVAGGGSVVSCDGALARSAVLCFPNGLASASDGAVVCADAGTGSLYRLGQGTVSNTRDQDGDGFRNDIEDLFSTDANDVADKPFDLTNRDFENKTMWTEKLQIALSRTTGRDRIKLTCGRSSQRSGGTLVICSANDVRGSVRRRFSP